MLTASSVISALLAMLAATIKKEADEISLGTFISQPCNCPPPVKETWPLDEVT